MHTHTILLVIFNFKINNMKNIQQFAIKEKKHTYVPYDDINYV